MIFLRILFGDLRRVAKDRWALVWLFIMPLVMAYVFGSAMRGGGPQATWIPVIDLNCHPLSALFIEQLRTEGYYIEVKPAADQLELKAKWPYGIVIPANFGEDILQGHQVSIPLVKGSAAPEKILEVQSRLLHAIVRFTKGLALADVSHHAWDSSSEMKLKAALSRPQLLAVAQRSYHTLRPPPSGFSQSLPGMLVMFVVQMVLTYGGVSLVTDRLGGQLRRVLAAPVGPLEAYSSKVLARMVLGFLQALVLLAAGAVLFKLPLGDHPVFLLPVVLCLAAVAGSMSLVAGVLCRTEKQVILVAIFGTMALSALGGCWWPIEIVPDAFKTMAHCIPTYWAIHGLQSVLYFGRGPEVLTQECPVLLGFAALFGLAALARARAR